MVDKKFKNPYVYAVVGIIAGALVLVVIPFIDFFVPTVLELFFIAIGSVAFFTGVLLYVRALQIEEASRLSVFWSFVPVFTLFGGWVFIGEELNSVQLLSFLILFVGGLVASLHVKSFGRFTFSRSFLLMLVATMFFAAYHVIIRYVSVRFSLPFEVMFVFFTIFPVCLSLLLFFSKKFRHDFRKDKKSFFTCKVLAIIVVINMIGKLGIFLKIKALSMAPVSLVSSLEGSQPIMVFAMTVLLTKFAPGIIKEEVDKRNILLKLSAIGIMVVGVVILSFG